MSAIEAHSILQLSVAVLNKMHTDLCFDPLVKQTQHLLHISEPSLPRQRKRPRRYEDGTAEPYQPTEPKLHYRQLYFQSIDTTIEDRFKQADYDRFYFWLPRKKTTLVILKLYWIFIVMTSIDMSLRLGFRYSKKWRLDAQETH